LVSAACQAGQTALGIDPVLIEIVQFAPGLAAVVTVLLFRGSTRWDFQFVPGTFTGRGVVRIGAAAAAAVFLILLTVALCPAAGIAVPVTPLSAVGPPVAALLVAQFVGACGEELGWRCFLQPTLGTRAGPVTTGVVVGLIWGLWHIQVIALGPWYLLGFLAATVGMSIVLALLLHSRGAPDLLVAGVFHFLINIGLLVVLDEETGDAAPEIAFGVGALAVAGCAVAARQMYLRVR
jgi:membrane protease YdiL (CAAX protease family)